MAMDDAREPELEAVCAAVIDDYRNRLAADLVQVRQLIADGRMDEAVRCLQAQRAMLRAVAAAPEAGHRASPSDAGEQNEDVA